MMILRGVLAGAKVSLIIHIHSIRDRFETMRLPVLIEHAEQLVFAMKTPHGVIARIGRILKLTRFHNLDRDLMLARECQRVIKMSARQAWRVSNHRDHRVFQHLASRPCQIRRIDAARIGHDQTWMRTDNLS